MTSLQRFEDNLVSSKLDIPIYNKRGFSVYPNKTYYNPNLTNSHHIVSKCVANIPFVMPITNSFEDFFWQIWDVLATVWFGLHIWEFLVFPVCIGPIPTISNVLSSRILLT